MSLFDIVSATKKQTEEQLARGGGRSTVRFWRPEAGANEIRIMPQWDEKLQGQFWREVHQHWNVSEDQKGPVLCPKNTPGLEGECPICDLVASLRQDKSNLEAQRFAKDIRAKRTYLLNVVVKGDPEYTAQDVAEYTQSRPDEPCPFEPGDPKIQIYACPITIFDSLLGIITTQKEDITDLKTGRTITIKKIPNKDRIKTRYEVYPSLKATDAQLGAPSIPDLSGVGFVLEYDKMVELLGNGKAADLGVGFGKLPTPKDPSLPTSDVEEQMRQALTAK
jgi:hypothetical protein